MPGLGQLFMSANHIAPQFGGFEPQRTNNGTIFIYGLEEFGARAESGVSIISASLAECPIPMMSFEPIRVPFMNQSRSVAGRMEFENIDLRLTDYVDKATMAVMLNWAAAVGDAQTGRIGLARQYKKRAEIFLFAPDGTTQRGFAAEGIWPTYVRPGVINMEGNDVNSIEANLSTDKVYPIPSDFISDLIRTASNIAGTVTSLTA